MSRFVRGVGALLVVASVVLGPARAADMTPPSYRPPAVAMPPATYDWTGIYIGGNLGAGLLKDSISQTGTGTTNLTGGFDLSPIGFIGGAQAGVNFDFHPLVLGAEISWTDTDISGSANQLTTTVPPNQERMTSAPLWFATATGRIGFAANTLLFYAKGGGAWMDVNYTQDQLTTGGATAASQLIHDHRTGFTAGLGLEYAMTENLSARLEYDFFGFGTRDYQFSVTPVSVASNLNALVVGLNYRFNWANGTAVERCPTC